MNALSAGWLKEPEYRIIEDKDPLELIDLQPDISICLVGAFFSYMQKISAAGSKLKIVELDKNAIPGEYHQHYIPAVDAGKTFATADVILITGATLANQSLESLLNQVPSGKKVIVVGPSGSLLPDALFDRGVQLVGATRIVDSDKMLSLVAEGAAGFHLFHYCAQKICILNEK
jgi:uncharacterized protein (DUF4213/DUF364 family)